MSINKELFLLRLEDFKKRLTKTELKAIESKLDAIAYYFYSNGFTDAENGGIVV